MWDTTKTRLGWLIYSAAFTLQLLPDKCAKIAKLIKKVCKMKFCPLKQFQDLASRLQHASFGIPGRRDLFSPIYRAMKTTTTNICLTNVLKSALLDWRTLIQHLGKTPTPVRLLVSKYRTTLYTWMLAS